ncbi:MAG TPA: hypothetical protein VK129_06835, partial [Terriglobales bacterium]|nr:hypothetical protein [Terriglobales bacterium]
MEIPLFVYTYNNAITFTVDDRNTGRRRSLQAGEGAYVRADLLDENEKRVIASDTMEPVRNEAENLIVILCNDKAVCNTTQAQILFGGSQEERNQKNNTFKFVILNDAESPNAWWAYGPVNAVVVAVPIHSLSEQKRSALEQYARQGGTLILLEREMASVDFLSSYRKGAITESVIPVGEGALLRISGLDEKKLQDRFSGGNLKKIGPDRVSWQIPQAE